jgi:FlaA1/EpsC-like NDP-sugar epimerase
MNLLRLAGTKNCKKYFCVSTDKATNPVSVMGASKLLMEKFILSNQSGVKVSTARFANVAFSDGSLLFGFENRLNKNQPLAVPADIRRFFITQEEAGQLCVLSCLIADDKEILFPKTNEFFMDISLVEIAEKYLLFKGFKPRIFEDELTARNSVEKCSKKGFWPCFHFVSDTTGEKPFEEFYAKDESILLNRYKNIGVVLFKSNLNKSDYDSFIELYEKYKEQSVWTKPDFVKVLKRFLPNFLHEEKNKNLDQKM